MVVKTSKLRRFLIGFLLTSLVVVVAFWIRTQTTLPYLDRARIAHFFSHQAWSDLADELWAEPQIDGVQLFPSDEGFEVEHFVGRFEVLAYDLDDGNSYDLELSPERQARYVELFAAAGIFLHMDRRENRLLTESGGGERFGRSFYSILISPRDGYQHTEECRGQYRQEDEGFCEVRLGENWLLGYSWFLPVEENWAKCAGFWREYDDSPIGEPNRDASRVGTTEHYGWAVDALGATDAERWAEKGRDQLSTALSTGDQDAVDRLLYSCSLP